MGKDKRSERKRCLRCTQWAEAGSELCMDCEQDQVDEMNRLRVVDATKDDATEGWAFHGGISPEVLRFTHFGPHFDAEKSLSGTFRVVGNDYLDALDQARADSLEGGE